MRIRPVAAELFRADWQTDRHDEANCRFRNSANAPKYDACPLELSQVGHKTGGDATSPSRSEALKSGETDAASPSDSRHSVPIVHRLDVADRHSFESAATDTSLPASMSPGPSFNTVTVSSLSLGSVSSESSTSWTAVCFQICLGCFDESWTCEFSNWKTRSASRLRIFALRLIRCVWGQKT